MSESLPEKIERAAQEIDALPSNKREALWILLWQGVVISFMVFFLEYVIWAPLWNYVVLPLARKL